MSSPRIGKFTNHPVIYWDNGMRFNGYACIAIVPPTIPAQGQLQYTVRGMATPATTLPLTMHLIPIENGVLDPNLGLYYNEDITPPNTRYVLYYADASKQIISGPSAYFTVSTPDILLPPMTIQTPVNTPPGKFSGILSTLPVALSSLSNNKPAKVYQIVVVNSNASARTFAFYDGNVLTKPLVPTTSLLPNSMVVFTFDEGAEMENGLSCQASHGDLYGAIEGDIK